LTQIHPDICAHQPFFRYVSRTLFFVFAPSHDRTLLEDVVWPRDARVFVFTAGAQGTVLCHLRALRFPASPCRRALPYAMMPQRLPLPSGPLPKGEPQGDRRDDDGGGERDTERVARADERCVASVRARFRCSAKRGLRRLRERALRAVVDLARGELGPAHGGGGDAGGAVLGRTEGVVCAEGSEGGQVHQGCMRRLLRSMGWYVRSMGWSVDDPLIPSRLTSMRSRWRLTARRRRLAWF
ncbi:hypothetical protein BKA93DRAFT_859292, partial [Sparassis latifolia]